MQLSDVQAHFKHYIFDDYESDEFEHTFQKSSISVKNRLDVYKNNVLSTLAAALKSTYPIVTALTGDDFMTYMAKSYAKAEQPTHGNLDLYGSNFADFIATFEPVKTLPYLPDVARLEWAVQQSYHAKNDAVFDPSIMNTIPEDKIADQIFLLRDSVNLLTSNYQVQNIRRWAQSPDEMQTPDVTKQTQYILIYRPEYAIHIQTLTKPEYNFIHNLALGYTLGSAGEKFISAKGNDMPLDHMLKQCFMWNLIRDIQ